VTTAPNPRMQPTRKQPRAADACPLAPSGEMATDAAMEIHSHHFEEKYFGVIHAMATTLMMAHVSTCPPYWLHRLRRSLTLARRV
jgi:hypothetical protein